MSQITKIVITGGPCAGKSTGMSGRKNITCGEVRGFTLGRA